MRNQNPNPRLNFDVVGHPEFAGDVNGDGVNDYVYTPGFRIPRDERTSALEDKTGKTALYFGGTPSKAEDQLLYSTLHPAGDLNGDGNDDAVRINGTDVRIFLGSSTGYQDTGVTLTSGGGQRVRGFVDFDGDGTEDVLLFSRRSNTFSVVYGGSSFSDATIKTYQTSFSPNYFQYNGADLDGSGDASIVRLAGEYDPNANLYIHVQTFDINSTRERLLTQDFKAEELRSVANRNQLSLVDVNGNGKREIVATVGIDAPASTFTLSSGEYLKTPTPLGDDDAIPVGDLDGDGRHDFYTFDDVSRTRYISYGPSTLSDGLTFDTEIPYQSSVVGRPEYDPRGGLGDVTGDGRPDVVLGLTDRSAETVGRRFFSVNSDRTARSPTDVTFPREYFFDNINETNEIGDFNDDGATDFAIVRNGLGKVELFYGGDPVPSSPSLTITPPADSLAPSNVSSGDFNGDGTSDLLVGYAPVGRFGGLAASPVTKIYFGGSSPDATADHSVFASTVGFRLDLPRAIGDINDDGATDWMASNRGFPRFETNSQSVAIFLGGSSLPSTPVDTMQYPDGNFVGEVKAALGDINGDGYDDFAFDNTVDFQFDVFLGGANPSFSSSSPDHVLSVRPYAGLAGGDYNGDGFSDIAAKTGFAANNAVIEVFYGGSTVDTTADRRLLAPINTGIAGSGNDNDGDGYANGGYGALETAGDVNGDGADELLLGSDSFVDGTNALLYRPSISREPVRVFRAPNQDASLGSQQFIWSTALGDFTGNGVINFVATQYDDRNDAYLSSRVYLYPTQLRAAVSLSAPSLSDTLALGNSSSRSLQIENTATGKNAGDLHFEILKSPQTASAPSSKIHVPREITPVVYDDPIGASVSATDSVGWSSPRDGYDWYCTTGTANQEITVTVERLSGDIVPNLGIGPGEVKNGAPVVALPDTLAATTDNSSNTTASLTYTPSSDGPVTIMVSTKSSEQAGGEYSLSVKGGTRPSSCGGSPPWVDVGPLSGTIPPGQSRSVTVDFAADAVPPGTHGATLRITSNDPAQDTVDVPVSLTVKRPPVSLSGPGSPQSPGAEPSVSLSIPSSISPIEGTLFYRAAGASTFDSTTVGLSGEDAGGTTSFTIPGSAVTKTGVQYYAQLKGLLPNGRDSLQLTVPATAPLRTAFVPVKASQIAVQGAFQAETYRMLTVPVALGDRSVFDVLKKQYGSYDPAAWKIARWAPSDSSYRFGSKVGSLQPGQAVWLITAGGDSLTVQNPRSIDASGPRSIPLASGWNQIGTPFPFPVDWEDVRRPESVRSPVVYDATKSDPYQFEAGTLQPWQGAFVYNEADSSVSIQVPPTGASGSTASAGISLAKAGASATGYRLQPIASLYRNDRQLKDRATRLGFSKSAEAGFGPEDRAKPPIVGSHVRLHVVPDDGPALARSLKPADSDGAAWDLRVGLTADVSLRSPQEVTVVLKEQGARPSGFQRYVIDRDRGKRLPVTNRSVSVTLTPDRPSRRLRVIVGTKAFARTHSKGASLAVEKTKLRTNAPNPFTESTTIPYQLAEEETVTIAIYDLLGRRVRTLVNDTQSAGVHQVEWAPGRASEGSLASGVYFCRMTAGSYTASRKLVLVR